MTDAEQAALRRHVFRILLIKFSDKDPTELQDWARRAVHTDANAVEWWLQNTPDDLDFWEQVAKSY